MAHEVFGLDRSEYANPWYRFRVIGAIGTDHPGDRGRLEHHHPYTLDDLDEADTVILPVWPGRRRRRRPSCSTPCGPRTARGGS